MHLKSYHTVFITLEVLFLKNGELDTHTLQALKQLIKKVNRVYLVCPLAYSHESLLALLRAYKIFTHNCLSDENMVSYYPFGNFEARAKAVEKILTESWLDDVCFIDIQHEYLTDSQFDFRTYFCEKRFLHATIVPRRHHINRHGIHPNSLHDFVHRLVTFS